MSTGTDGVPTVGRFPQRQRLDQLLVERKLKQFFELHEPGKELALDGIRRQFPEANEQEQYQRLAERLAIFREGKWRGRR